MDPISLSTLLGLITQSAAGEAGKSAWEGMAGLARRAFGHGRQAEAALQQAKDGDQGGTLDLAGRLVQAAATDPELARLLQAWITETQRAAAQRPVTNTISGHARIRGTIIQAGHIDSVQQSGQIAHRHDGDTEARFGHGNPPSADFRRS